MKKILFYFLGFALSASTYAQNQIVSYEYWFDEDVANKTVVSTTPMQVLNLETGLPTSSLNTGLHKVQMRGKDLNGAYSAAVVQYFLKVNAGETGVAAYEYWWDDDVANAVEVGVGNTDVFELATSIDAQSIPQGLHRFHIRFRDGGNRWSSVVNQVVYKSAIGNIVDEIVGYQYWFDNDIVNAQFVETTPSEILVLDEELSNSLGNGLHRFHIRFRDGGNRWSSTVNQMVYKSAIGTNVDEIVGYQYWFDNDIVNAQFVETTPSEILMLDEGLSNSLNNGLHKLHIRFKDGGGRWSSAINQNFFKVPEGQSPPNGINGYRYWFDDSTDAIEVVEIGFSTNPYLLFEGINMLPLDTGYHVLHVQMRDERNQWSSAVSDTIYNYGEPSLSSITPNQGGNIGFVTANIYGNGFFDGSIVKLVKEGEEDIVVPDSLMTILNNRTRIVATINLIDRALGFWDVVVEVPEADTILVLVDGFEIEVGFIGELDLTISGIVASQPNNIYPFVVSVYNNSNVDRIVQGVVITSYSGNPLGLTANELNENRSSIFIPFDDSGQFLPHIGPNSSLSQVIYTKSSSTASTDHFGAFWIASDVSEAVLADINFGLPNSESDEMQLSQILCEAFSELAQVYFNVLFFPEVYAGSDYSTEEDLCSCIPELIFSNACAGHDDCYATCNTGRTDCDSRFLDDMMNACDQEFLCDTEFGAVLIPQCYAAAHLYYLGVRSFGWSFYSDAQDENGCDPELAEVPVTGPTILDCLQDDCPPGIECYDSPKLIFFSRDPNAKYGPVGSSDLNYITSNPNLAYLITFENDTSATAPAQWVQIVDTLDSNVFDFESFQLGFISFGDTVINIPSGVQHWIEYVDMRPTQDLVVLVEIDFDDLTGIAIWTFTALNPLTYQSFTDALDGFLPPNVNEPEGEGSVFYTVHLLDGLEFGTEISNKAYIYFDNNEPIVTDDWVNTLDNVLPESAVNSLSEYIPSTSFEVNWSGNDLGAGVQNYDIYVSANDGPYELWLYNQTGTSAIYTGAFDSTYSFYSIAQDSTGNFEVVPLEYDARTTLVDCSVYSLELSINGDIEFCSGESIEVTVSGSNEVIWNNEWGEPTITITESGEYFATATFDEVCILNSDSLMAIVNPLPDVYISGDVDLCEGETTVLTANGAEDYLWSNEQTSESIQVSTSGEWSVAGIDANGCSATSESVSVVAHPNPIASIELVGELLEASPADLQYAWFLTGEVIPDETGPTILPMQDGGYSVLVTDGLGCADTSDVFSYVLIYEMEGKIGVNLYPNPNDGEFSISLLLPQSQVMQVEVVDNIGQIIFAGTYYFASDGIRQQIDLGTLADGSYTMRISGETGVVVRRFTLIH
jgi:hypothetical protein